tara:strand:- start:434 stop:715 length:282 start_codon:yes stop_codon:yes gene_type:complete
MFDTLKNNLASIAALIAAIVAIGGGFTKYGEINTRLGNIEKRMGSDKKGTSIQTNTKAIAEVDKNSQINSKEIELLKLQIREIQAKSGNPLSN